MAVALIMGAHSFPAAVFLPLNWIIPYLPQSWKFTILGRYSFDGLFQSNDRPVWDMLPGDVTQGLSLGKWRNLDRNERTKGSETPL